MLQSDTLAHFGGAAAGRQIRRIATLGFCRKKDPKNGPTFLGIFVEILKDVHTIFLEKILPSLDCSKNEKA